MSHYETLFASCLDVCFVRRLEVSNQHVGVTMAYSFEEKWCLYTNNIAL